MSNEKLMKGDVIEFASNMKKLVNNKDHRFVMEFPFARK